MNNEKRDGKDGVASATTMGHARFPCPPSQNQSTTKSDTRHHRIHRLQLKNLLLPTRFSSKCHLSTACRRRVMSLALGLRVLPF